VQTFEFEGAPGHVCLQTATLAERDGKTLLRTVSAFQFPEAVAVAEVLADPAWRHHVATVPARQAGQFYRRVSARLGEGTYLASASDDPLIA
jgi:hypothetical protein